MKMWVVAAYKFDQNETFLKTFLHPILPFSLTSLQTRTNNYTTDSAYTHKYSHTHIVYDCIEYNI